MPSEVSASQDSLGAGSAGEQTRTPRQQVPALLPAGLRLRAPEGYVFIFILQPFYKDHQAIKKYSLKSNSSKRRMAESLIQSGTEQSGSFASAPATLSTADGSQTAKCVMGIHKPEPWSYPELQGLLRPSPTAGQVTNTLVTVQEVGGWGGGLRSGGHSGSAGTALAQGSPRPVRELRQSSGMWRGHRPPEQPRARAALLKTSPVPEGTPPPPAPPLLAAVFDSVFTTKRKDFLPVLRPT